MTPKIILINLLLLSWVLLINGCKETNVNTKKTQTTTQSNNTAQPTTCTVGETVQVDCTNEVSGATKASKTRYCTNTSSGPQPYYGSCQIETCTTGKSLVNNFCVNNTTTCSGNSSQTCTIQNGTGIQTRTCNNGSWSQFSTCSVSSCNSGYVQVGNTCVVPVCNGSTSQACAIQNGTGIQTRTCNNGSWSQFSTCSVSSCNSGYVKVGNTCVVPVCEGSTTQTCGVTNGTGHQVRTCNNGTWSAFGPCVAQTCNPGYQVENGQCKLLVCAGDSTRTCSENHGQGIQSRECNLGVWSNWGSCVFSSCDTGYLLKNNACVIKTCDGNSSQSCTVTNGSGIQTRTCINGTWSAYSACQATFCNNGYEVKNGSCVPVSCSGGSSFACYVDNGIGTQTRYCNLGVWSDYGDCTVTSCNTGYNLLNNSCRPSSCGGISTRSCTTTNGIGIQSRTCTNGQWSSYGTCNAVKCNSNAELINGSCVIKTCLESNSRTCSDSTGSGYQFRVCSNGTWGSYGECLKDKCVAGYEVKDQHCTPVTCQGLSTQSCSIENGTGLQKRFCQNGTWTNWGPCVLKECNGTSDYLADKINNRCVCSVYTTQSCTGTHGSGMKTRTCTNNTWSAYSNCQLYFCDTGYSLNVNTNTCE